MADRRGKNVESLRNLPQYKGLSDDEIMDKVGARSFDARIQNRLGELAKHYDISELKYNDILLLERWATLTERLQMEERVLRQQIEEEDITPNDALKEEQRLGSMQAQILKIQEALNITRAKRRDKTEDNPRLLFEEIRSRAAKFYKERLAYLKCPKCGIILCTVSFTYPNADNKIMLNCEHCDTESEFTSEEAINLEKNNPYK